MSSTPLAIWNSISKEPILIPKSSESYDMTIVYPGGRSPRLLIESTDRMARCVFRYGFPMYRYPRCCSQFYKGTITQVRAVTLGPTTKTD